MRTSPDSVMMSDQERREELALKFYTGCFDGNLEEVKRIVSETPIEQLDINRVIHGGTAFAAAVQNSHLEVVKYLAALGADMEIPIHDGATPIFIACYRGNMEIVRFLCSQMVNLEKANANGNTPFAIAAQHRRLDIAEVLLQHGVNIAPVNKKGSTPFFFACQEGNLDVVKFLVRNGADVSMGKNGISPFHMACYRGHLDVVTYLVVEVDVDPRAVDGSGRTPLEVARRAGKEEVIRFLQQLDADQQREVDPLPLCAGPNGSCSDAGCIVS
mmetsp:Transcript_10725/g.35543  ORF Transcript_10725/g.35543 Transcript_10725/m.35543 type:complete len:272 (-) Transcript_10725:154-969(-)